MRFTDVLRLRGDLWLMAAVYMCTKEVYWAGALCATIGTVRFYKAVQITMSKDVNNAVKNLRRADDVEKRRGDAP